MYEEGEAVGSASASVESLPEGSNSPQESLSMDAIPKQPASSNESILGDSIPDTKSNKSIEDNNMTGMGLNMEREQGDPNDAEENENSLFLTNPFGKGMEKIERCLRVFLLIGILPLPILGWIIGTIYSFIAAPTKRIQKKLQMLLVLLSALGILMTVIALTILFAELKSNETKLSKSSGARPLNLDAYVPPEQLPPPETKKAIHNEYLIEYAELSPSFKVNTYSMNVQDLRDKKRKSVQMLKDMTKTFLLDQKENVSIAVELEIEEYLAFKEFVNEHKGFKHIFVINPEVACEKGEDKDINETKITNFVGFTQVDLNCGGKNVKMPIQVTQDGMNRYEKRGPELTDLVKYFFNVSVPKEKRCYREKGTRELTKEYLDFVEDPFRKFLAYTDVNVMDQSPLNKLEMCNKAL
ncbi:hypothetical protein BEWA_008950 [Theileria equi strain WA]|uniref:Uncharacterized protein n=1 Tax=Theileria equi strain WA TaxID=1537102 RepID=L0B1Y0_THEEQ|nr:hypothetical protein BEWA_008950 [Theileria equi strain WA]AFZ81483.1 hypothetical protein BEWA_008950 [Theileria equi strain WA]|eukprot:XP_004831149.1 hypothetical protein BEWA_008950 [Theileria equi strain WA]